jgi:hypothetical protein
VQDVTEVLPVTVPDIPLPVQVPDADLPVDVPQIPELPRLP